MAVIGGVAHGGNIAVGQADFGRTLHVCDVSFERIAEVYQLLAFEHSGILYLGPVGIGADPAAGVAPSDDVAVRPFYQVVGLLVKRAGELRRPLQRAFEDRRVVAGKQHGSPVVASDGSIDVEADENLVVELSAAQAGIEHVGKALNAFQSLVMRDLA